MNKNFEIKKDVQVETQGKIETSDTISTNDLASENGVDLNACENQDLNSNTNPKRGMSKAYYPPPPPPVPAEIRYIDDVNETESPQPRPETHAQEIMTNFEDGDPIDQQLQNLENEDRANLPTSSDIQGDTDPPESDNLSNDEKLLNDLQQQYPDYSISMPQYETADVTDETPDLSADSTDSSPDDEINE